MIFFSNWPGCEHDWYYRQWMQGAPQFFVYKTQPPNKMPSQEVADNLAKQIRELDGENPKARLDQLNLEIVANKELRQALDVLLQKMKSLPASRHRALSITHLEDSIMRLGMDLKRLGELQPRAPAVESKTSLQLAKEAYGRYGATTSWKNFRGDPMPDFEALPETIQSAWVSAITVESNPSPTNPYPNSYDPSNTKVDPTADGLKL